MKNQVEMVERLAGAIPIRRSVYAFDGEPVAGEALEGIRGFVSGFSAPFEHSVRLELFGAEAGRKLYVYGSNPPTNIAILAQTDLVSISKAGFIGELAMLYIASLRLSGSWFGHYRLAELGKYIPGISGADRLKESPMGHGYGDYVDVGERAICCLAIGYKDAGKKQAGLTSSSDRQPVEALLENPGLALEIPEHIAYALDLARLAPSAGNSQMWRFGFRDGFRAITVAKPISYKHARWEHPDVDIGICAAHLWLGLLQKGYDPAVDVATDGDRALWSLAL